MGKRGFLAEMQRAAKAAARENERRQREAHRQYAAQVKAAERAAAQERRAMAAASRASEADRKRFEKEQQAAHIAAMQAETESRNAQVDAVYDDIDSLLQATLGVDDHVDLEELRQQAVHPPFPRPDLLQPLLPPPPIPDPPAPAPVRAQEVKGVFGRKKKIDAAQAAADAQYAQAYAAWQHEMSTLPGRRQAAADAWQQAEQARQAELSRVQAQHKAECDAREAQVAAQNSELDALIAGLGYGTADAIQEYVGIVMANSVYPEHFPVEHDFEFEPSTAELSLRCVVIPPDEFPTIKQWKYVKASDELKQTDNSQKATRDRYANAVAQVALRSLHEVFEADRRGLIKTIALEVGAEAAHPATGIVTFAPFVAVAAERNTFVEFDLSSVVPEATLQHLGASVSKNPYALTAADTSGVRRS